MDETCRQYRDLTEVAMPTGRWEGGQLISAEGVYELVDGEWLLIED